MLNESNIKVPLTVPPSAKNEYIKNYLEITKSTGKLMLFAGDQKMEHLNDDFYGENIAQENANPVHLFNIASKAKIGVFATQLGLISQYGEDFRNVPYLIKLNSKTHLVKTAQAEARSRSLQSVDQIVEFKKNSRLNILGIGYTVYFGSEYENEMLTEAAQAIYKAHQNGLIAVIWGYARGKAVTDEKSAHLIAGSAGAAACLGADFVKTNPPKQEGVEPHELLKEAVMAAGRTKLVCAGGSATDPQQFLQALHNQIHIAGVQGNATGRNIHQKPLDEAVRFTNAIYAITVEGKSVDEVLKVYKVESL